MNASMKQQFAKNLAQAISETYGVTVINAELTEHQTGMTMQAQRRAIRQREIARRRKQARLFQARKEAAQWN